VVHFPFVPPLSPPLSCLVSTLLHQCVQLLQLTNSQYVLILALKGLGQVCTLALLDPSPLDPIVKIRCTTIHNLLIAFKATFLLIKYF